MGLYSYVCTNENKKKQSGELSTNSQIKDKENLSLPLVKNGGLQDKESHDMKKAAKDSLV